MIIEYQRPETIAEALKLLARQFPKSIPLGGGGYLSRNSEEDVAVVDLQALGLDHVQVNNDNFIIGGTTKLQALLELKDLPKDLKMALVHENPSLNSRNTSTIAGVLLRSSGSSPFAASMIALDAVTYWLPGRKQESIGSVLILRGRLPGAILERVEWSRKSSFGYSSVGRSPADRPYICVAACQWPSGRLRIVLGLEQFAEPIVVMDGPSDGSDYRHAIKNACSQYSDKYLLNTAITLTNRIIKKLQGSL